MKTVMKGMKTDMNNQLTKMKEMKTGVKLNTFVEEIDRLLVHYALVAVVAAGTGAVSSRAYFDNILSAL